MRNPLNAVRSPRTSPALGLVALGVLLAFVYLPALHGPFLLDDFSSVLPAVLGHASPRAVLEAAYEESSGVYGRPLPVLTFSLNGMFGQSTFAFKATNLIVHAVNAVLLFVLLRSLQRAIAREPGERSGSTAWWLAFVVVAFWALHPLQVSATMYVVQRMTLMATGFTLLALVAYCDARHRMIDGRTCGVRRRFLVFVVATALALGSKESAVLIAPYVVMVELMFFRLRAPAGSPWPRGFVLASALVGTGGLVVSFVALDHFLAGYALREFDLVERLTTQPVVLVHYLRLIVMPDLDLMGLYRDDFPISTSFGATEWLAVLILALPTVAAIVSARRFPLIAFGWLLFLVSHALESTAFPLELVFEHRNYLGSAGVLLALCEAVRHAVPRSTSRFVLVLPVVALVALSSLQTRSRSLEWSTALSHNAAAVEAHPGSVRAHSFLALTLADLGLLSAAAEAIDEGYEALGGHPVIVGLRLQVHAFAGSFDPTHLDEALRVFATAPVDFNVVTTLDLMRKGLEEGRVERPDAADLVALHEAVRINPEARISPLVMPQFDEHYASLLSEAGLHERAIAVGERMRIDYPHDARSRLALASALHSAGRDARALETLGPLRESVAGGHQGQGRVARSVVDRARRLAASIEALRVGESDG